MLIQSLPQESPAGARRNPPAFAGRFWGAKIGVQREMALLGVLDMETVLRRNLLEEGTAGRRLPAGRGWCNVLCIRTREDI